MRIEITLTEAGAVDGSLRVEEQHGAPPSDAVRFRGWMELLGVLDDVIGTRGRRQPVRYDPAE